MTKNIASTSGEIKTLDGKKTPRLARLPWWTRDAADWRAGTRGMSLELRGFYREVLYAQWDLRAELPLDDKKVAMLLACSPRLVRAFMPRLIALGKITRTPTGYDARKVVS